MVHMRTKPAGPDRFSQLTPLSTDSLRNREPGQAAGGPVQQRSAATRPTSIESRATGVTPSPAQTTFADLAVSEKDVIAAVGPGQAQSASVTTRASARNGRVCPRPGRRLSRAPSRAGALTGHGGRRRATGPASLSIWLLAVTRSPAPR